jgi:deaminated glutathione amidase
VKVAVLQMCSGIDPAANAVALVAAIEEAAQLGAAMLFTPEMSGLIDRNRARAAPRLANEAGDLVLAAVRKAAQENGIWIALGSLAFAGERSDERLVNRSLLIDSDGNIRARYDKIHLFDVDLATGESWRESAAYAPGDQAVVAQTPVGELGLSVCYDVRFPALYQALSGAGAQVLAVPAAFTVPTGKAHWHVLLRARAIENACWVVAAAQSGTHEDGRETYGHSLIINPWGEIMLDMQDRIGLGFAEIDLAAVGAARARVPVIKHRRAIAAVPQSA